MPIRSPRAVYAITGMTSNVNDSTTVIDNLPGGTEPKTTKPVYCKMKISIGDFLGFTPLLSSDPIFIGTFKAGGLNAGAKYFKNIGGFREASYKVVSKGTFTINERVYDKTTKTTSTIAKNFKSFSIGFPKGHSVVEFITWLKTSSKIGLIQAVITPKGRRIDVGTNAPPGP